MLVCTQMYPHICILWALLLSRRVPTKCLLSRWGPQPDPAGFPILSHFIFQAGECDIPCQPEEIFPHIYLPLKIPEEVHCSLASQISCCSLR